MFRRSRAVAFLLAVSACAATPQPALPCATCHPRETARFLHSKMGNSIGAPTPQPAGEIKHAPSGSVIAIEQRDGRMIHRLTEHGLTAEYAIDYQIGAGLAGFSYLVRIGDYFFQSPASWYKTHGWDISPGYQQLPGIDFTRVITSDCLFCHAGAVKFADPDGRRVVNPALTAITCERCHGPTANHLRRPVPGSIVNPAKLSGHARDSVCAQCHLEGAARIVNPGMAFTDFHPGEDLASVIAVYVDSGAEAAAHVVNHFEQLAQSHCARASGGKLWCGTCHDPHGETADRVAEMRAICTSCHATLSAQAHPAGTLNCLPCHMPRSSAEDIPHTAITDHRILRRPQESPIQPGGAPRSLRAWTEPAPEFRDRDLALAELTAGYQYHSPDLIRPAAALLDKITSDPSCSDAVALYRMGGLLVNQERLWAGVGLSRRAAELRPDSADYAYNLGVDLRQVGDLIGAERELKRATELDPLLEAPYMALFALQYQQRRADDALATLDRYLKQNPQNIEFRTEKTRVVAGQ